MFSPAHRMNCRADKAGDFLEGIIANPKLLLIDACTIHPVDMEFLASYRPRRHRLCSAAGPGVSKKSVRAILAPTRSMIGAALKLVISICSVGSGKSPGYAESPRNL